MDVYWKTVLRIRMHTTIVFLHLRSESHVMVKELSKLHHHQREMVLRKIHIRVECAANLSHIWKLLMSSFTSKKPPSSLFKSVIRWFQNAFPNNDTTLILLFIFISSFRNIFTVIVFWLYDSTKDGIGCSKERALQIVANSVYASKLFVLVALELPPTTCIIVYRMEWDSAPHPLSTRST